MTDSVRAHVAGSGSNGKGLDERKGLIKEHTLSQLSAAPQTNVGHIFHRDQGNQPEDAPHFQLSG